MNTLKNTNQPNTYNPYLSFSKSCFWPGGVPAPKSKFEEFESLFEPPNWRSSPPNCTSRFDKESPGISTAELGILEGGGSLALGSALLAELDPFVTAAGLMGLNAEPGAAEAKEGGGAAEALE